MYEVADAPSGRLSFDNFCDAIAAAMASLLPDVVTARTARSLVCRRVRAAVVLEHTMPNLISIAFCVGTPLLATTTDVSWDALQDCIADVTGFFTGAPVTSITIAAREQQRRAAAAAREARLPRPTHCACTHALNAHDARGCRTRYLNTYGVFTACACDRSPGRVAERTSVPSPQRVRRGAFRRFRMI